MKPATTLTGKATDDIIDKGRKIAGFLLETGEIDIEFELGRYRVAGTDREVSIFEVAAADVTRKSRELILMPDRCLCRALAQMAQSGGFLPFAR